MSEEVSHRLLITAVAAARQAGEYLLSMRGKIGRDAIEEKAKNDLVTIVDRNSEALIVNRIRSEFPSHEIIGEEGGKQASASEYQWIIDPLDGTTNFLRNLPVFCVSIGVRYQGMLIAGVVYDPVQNELFSASQGKGATLNDIPIRVSSSTDFSRAFIGTGFPHQTRRRLPNYISAFAEIFHASGGMRRIGSASMDLCYTACGRFEGFWEEGLNIWDVAAGVLIIKEAGGIVSDFWGGDTYLNSGYIVAGNAATHSRLVSYLSRHFVQEGLS